MKLDEDNDFGFSVVTKDEIEEDNRRKIDYTSDKLYGLRDMIMPLLKNLLKDPEKEYILWPNRVEKIKDFIEKIDRYVYDDEK